MKEKVFRIFGIAVASIETDDGRAFVHRAERGSLEVEQAKAVELLSRALLDVERADAERRNGTIYKEDPAEVTDDRDQPPTGAAAIEAAIVRLAESIENREPISREQFLRSVQQ